MQKVLVVVGRGNFAQIILKKLSVFSQNAYVAISFEQMQQELSAKQLSKDIVAALIHVGSGQQLAEAIDFCQQTSIPLIQASTGMKYELPSPCDFACIDAPNLAIPILRFIKSLSEMRMTTKNGYRITITESHQASKNSLPGTAVKMAEILGISRDQIESIRDPRIQMEFVGIPEEDLDGHAFHQIFVRGHGVDLVFKTQILGRDAYVYGILSLLGFFQINEEMPVLDKGPVSVLDIINYL